MTRPPPPAAALLLLLSTLTSATSPLPTPWPERFHAVLYMNLSGFNSLQITNLWYDWPAGRNVNLVQKQLGPLIHDVEWNNGTSYYYTKQPDVDSCRTELFGVGIPRRGFMDGAEYLGRWHTDGFLCDVWEKLEFITYYEEVGSRRPVRWDFSEGGTASSSTDSGSDSSDDGMEDYVPKTPQVVPQEVLPPPTIVPESADIVPPALDHLIVSLVTASGEGNLDKPVEPGGIWTHVMTFEEGGVLEESEWQAPPYCFDKDGEGSRGLEGNEMDVHQLHNLRRLSF